MNVLNFMLLTVPLLGPVFACQFAQSAHFLSVFQRVAGVSIGCFFATNWLIPVVARYTVKKLFGKDINKRGTPAGEVRIPESLGIACGIIYLMCGVVCQFWFAGDTGKLVEYNASLLSICLIILLGFIDDVLDIPWRYKLLVPAVATLPILIAYNGDTTLRIPVPLAEMLDTHRVLDLGWLYLFYMFLLCIFCSNAVNIHAGINGLEAGQSLIIGCAILTHNVIEGGTDDIGRSQHVLSLFLVAPFVASSAALLMHNWYPSQVFVGDTYTMFSGMTLAVASVMGHFSKTLLLFFIPQVLNFLYSVPQLFHLFGYTCPRHRLPFYNPKTRLLEGIPSNLNLVNLFLCIFGPMSERQLCIVLLIFQFLCCSLGFVIRYRLEYYLY